MQPEFGLREVTHRASRLVRWLFFVDDDPEGYEERLSFPVFSSRSVGDSKYSLGKTRTSPTYGEKDESSNQKPSPTTQARNSMRKKELSRSNQYTARMLLWTLLVEFWIHWTPEAVDSDVTHLLYLEFLGIMVILKLHGFHLSTQCVKSGVLYTLTVLCASLVLIVVSQPVFLKYEYLAKKTILKEYSLCRGKSPHVYVIVSGLAIMTCMARGLHKR